MSSPQTMFTLYVTRSFRSTNWCWLKLLGFIECSTLHTFSSFFNCNFVYISFIGFQQDIYKIDLIVICHGHFMSVVLRPHLHIRKFFFFTYTLFSLPFCVCLDIWHLLTIIFGVGFACSLVIISICLFVVW